MPIQWTQRVKGWVDDVVSGGRVESDEVGQRLWIEIAVGGRRTEDGGTEGMKMRGQER